MGVIRDAAAAPVSLAFPPTNYRLPGFDRCGCWAPLVGGGVMLCTLLAGHGGDNHLDVVHNRPFPR